jgi:hypothetical protein
MWMTAGAVRPDLRQWYQPYYLGDIKKFIEKDIISGTLNASQPEVFDIDVVAATDGFQGAADSSALRALVDDTQYACLGGGWDEISWPFATVGGVQNLTPREAGTFGCNGTLVQWPLGAVWDVGYPGTIGKRSILCFKFTKL